MAPRVPSMLILWLCFLQSAESVSLGLRRGPGPGGVDWVEKNLRNRAQWTPIIQKCATRQLAAVPQPPAPNVSSPPGPSDEFSDMTAAELDWVEQQYTAWCGPGCPLPPRNRTDVNFHVAPADASVEFPLTGGSCSLAYKSADVYTCKFTNLYSKDGVLTAHILKGTDFPKANLPVAVSSGKLSSWQLGSFVHTQTHNSMDEFLAFIRTEGYALHGNKSSEEYTVSTYFEGVTSAFIPLWHFNIGHALYDGLYPAFVSLIPLNLHTDPFRLLYLGGDPPPNVEVKVPGAFARNEAVMGQVAGKGSVRNSALRNDMDKVRSIFETLVIGMSYSGQKLDMNANFTLGGGRDLAATKLFRAHAFQSLGLPLQARVSKDETLKGIVIHNRRWGKRDFKLPWLEPLIQKAGLNGVALNLIVWSGKPKEGNAKDDPSPGGDTFREQIRMISKTHIHISSPGTAMMYQHFLPDGAVHINLGENAFLPMLFMEESMAEGASYIRALYYWPNGTERKGYDPDRILDLVLEARDLIRGSFEIPVPVNTNLSPVLRVVKVYEHLTTKDPENIRLLTPLRFMRGTKSAYDTDFFGNHFAHEFFSASTRGDPRHMNLCLLQALASSYGDPCRNCSWGFDAKL